MPWAGSASPGRASSWVWTSISTESRRTPSTRSTPRRKRQNRRLPGLRTWSPGRHHRSTRVASFSRVFSQTMWALLVSLSILLLAGVLGARLATRLGQPAVLGELVAGVVVGNLALANLP